MVFVWQLLCAYGVLGIFFDAWHSCFLSDIKSVFPQLHHIYVCAIIFATVNIFLGFGRT